MNDVATIEAAAPAAAAQETVRMLPWDELVDSPFNPRKTFLDIEELTEDIKSLGAILQPLVARPRMVLIDGREVQRGYELVFGHRRKRAGIAAGLPGAPVIVRQMTDAQSRRAQISENLARLNVHPIEEAEGFATLMREDGVTADELAAQLGKSKSFVYSRLKLLQAVPEIREACVKGEIGSETALLIARLRHPKLQQKALARLKAKCLRLDDGGNKNFRQIRNLLIDEFSLHISSQAIFDPEDPTLLPCAGVCSTCPKRSGNAPEYGDTLAPTQHPWGGTSAPAGPDLCTDPDCFAEKKTAHLKREAAAIRKEGKEVIDGNKARTAISAEGQVKGAYVAYSSVKAQLKKSKQRSADGTPVADVIKPVIIQDPRTGNCVEAIKIEDLKGTGIEPPAPKKAGHDWQEEARKREEQSKKLKEQAAKELPKRFSLLLAVRAAMDATERCEFDLRLVAKTTLDFMPYDSEEVLAKLWKCGTHELHGKLRTLNLQEVTRFLLDCALVENVSVDYHELDNKPASLIAAAEYYGVDIEAAREGQLLLAQEPDAAPADEDEAPADDGVQTSAQEPDAVAAPADAVAEIAPPALNALATALSTFSTAPRPRREFVPAAVFKLLDDGLAVTELLPSPYQADNSFPIEHLRITAAGRDYLSAHSTPAPTDQATDAHAEPAPIAALAFPTGAPPDAAAERADLPPAVALPFPADRPSSTAQAHA